MSKTRVHAAGRERNLFEHQFQVAPRRRGGRIQSQHHVAADSARTPAVATRTAGRQTGTLEAVDLSEKDGALVCLVQVRVRFGG